MSTYLSPPDDTPRLQGPSPQPQPPSAFERFLNNFLREENIKWISVIGAAIVLASSLMLVTRQWHAWNSELKYLTILAYTAVTYLCGNFAKGRLCLKTTGRAVQLLALMLLPVCFLALGWLDQAAYLPSVVLEKTLLVLPALALTYRASSKIFTDLFREQQPTFLASFCLLCVAGALNPMSTPTTAALFVVSTWMVMTLGVIKINRHIFWMTEEYKQPRIFAFFPIALLGGQFLILVTIKALPQIEIQWLGSICVLSAATILLTARSVAEVFRQRTGNLVRPLPGNIVAPLVIGLIVLTAGVVLSCYGFSFTGPTTLAVLPTAILAAALLIVVAWDSGSPAFVWPALVLLTIAYQVTPVLFRDSLMLLRQQAATAMNEPRLPLAFYGITYLPLIVTLVAVSGWCRRRQGPTSRRLNLFAGPMQMLASGMTVLLLVASFTHLKALVLVSLLDTVLLLAMAYAFRERAYAILSLLCAVIVSVLIFPFGHAIGWWHMAIADIPTSVAALGFILAVAPGLDRALARIPTAFGSKRLQRSATTFVSAPSVTLPICVTVGYLLALAAAVAWTISSVMQLPNLHGNLFVQWAIIAPTFLVATLRTRDYFAAQGFWCVMAIGCALVAAATNPTFNVWFSIVSTGTCVVTLALVPALAQLRKRLNLTSWHGVRTGSILLRPMVGTSSVGRSTSEASAVNRVPFENMDGGRVQMIATLLVALRDLSLAVALSLAAICVLPTAIIVNMGGHSFIPAYVLALFMVWGGALTWLTRSRAGGLLIGAFAPLMVTAVLFTSLPQFVGFPTQLLIYTFVAMSLAIVGWSMRANFLLPMFSVAQAWLGCLALVSLLNADPVYRAIGIASALTLTIVHWRLQYQDGRCLAWIYLNLQLLLGAFALVGVTGSCFTWPLQSLLPVAIIATFPLQAVSVWLFDVRRLPIGGFVKRGWAASLRVLGLFTACVAFAYADSLTLWWPFVVSGALLFAIGELAQAVRYQHERYVWRAVGILALPVAWAIQVGLLEIGVGFSQVVLAVCAALGLLFSHLLHNHSKAAVFIRPLFAIGITCPGLLTAMAVWHECINSVRAIDPVSTLLMFAAAFVYFHQAHLQRNRWLLLLSVVILNVAIGLTAYGLKLGDAQFYCVPLGLSIIAIVQMLKREIPHPAHDPLRYIGSLMVLVSPIFQIIEGSWLHMVCLMLLCVLVVLLAIGLRVRALLGVGTAFLLADLVIMVVRSSIDNPSMLWISGLGIGGGVILLAAYCERHREQVLGRIRLLSAELASWN